MRLVADVGGTNARVGLSEGIQILHDTVQSYANDEWQSLDAILDAYLSDRRSARPSEMVIAVAGPVNGDHARLTNRDWAIETSLLKQNFGCDRAELLNDLTALGYAVPVLKTDQLRAVGGGARKPSGSAQSLVVGIGTGFNVSPVLEKAGQVFCPAVEAGHISMPVSVIRAMAGFGMDTHAIKTVEDLFSGRGFVAFCRAATGSPMLAGPAAVDAYGTGGASDVTQAIDRYAILLGHLLRDMSLAYMPSSGMYLAGSIARSVLKVASAPCMEILRGPGGAIASFDAPVWTIEDDVAALHGCAGYAFA